MQGPFCQCTVPYSVPPHQADCFLSGCTTVGASRGARSFTSKHLSIPLLEMLTSPSQRTHTQTLFFSTHADRDAGREREGYPRGRRRSSVSRSKLLIMRASCLGETRGAARRQGHPAGCFESMGMVKEREGGGRGEWEGRIRGLGLGKKRGQRRASVGRVVWKECGSGNP